MQTKFDNFPKTTQILSYIGFTFMWVGIHNQVEREVILIYLG